MQEPFRKLSTNSNLFREARMPKMAGKDSPPDTNAEVVTPGTRKQEVDVKKAVGNMFKDLRSSPILKEDKALNEATKGLKAVPAQTQTFDTKETREKTELKPIEVQIDTSKAREQANKSDLQRAMDAARDTQLSHEQAVKAMTTLVDLLSAMGPETNLRSDINPAVRKALDKAINGFSDRNLLLATVHILSNQNSDPRVIKGNLKDLSNSLMDRLMKTKDEQLLAYLPQSIEISEPIVRRGTRTE